MKLGAWRWWLWPLLAALLTFLACGFVPPTYTAHTVLAPRLSPPSWATQLMGQPQLPTLRLYGALLQSRRLNERIALRFGLQQVYREASLEATLARLAQNTRFGSINNGLLAIEVDDVYPWRAADMATQYAAELQRLLDELRLERTQAGVQALQQDLSQTQQQLAAAQARLQASGIDAASLRLDRNLVIGEQLALRQAAWQAELKLQGLRHGLRDSSPAVQAQLATLGALRRLQGEAQAPQSKTAVDGSYAEAWRELQGLERWQRTLRLQLAAAETAAGHRDDALIVVDRAEMPQRRGGPPALLLMLAAAGLSVLVLLVRQRGLTPRPAQSRRYSPA